MSRASWALFFSLASGTIASSADGATIRLNAVDTGHYTEGAGHLFRNPNYIAGELEGLERRNFFLFDLSSVPTGTVILAAELRVSTGTIVTLDASETYTLFSVTTDPDTVRFGGADPGSLIFNDLADGTVLGSREYSLADQQMTLGIPLTAAGLAAIDAAGGGLLVFGGAVTSLSGAEDEFLFGGTQLPFHARQLVLTTVPEPATLLLLLAAAGALAVRKPAA